MAQNPTPELYLWLLSGQPEYDRVLGISPEGCNNSFGSHLSGHPFPNDLDRLMNHLRFPRCYLYPKTKVRSLLCFIVGGLGRCNTIYRFQQGGPNRRYIPSLRRTSSTSEAKIYLRIRSNYPN